MYTDQGLTRFRSSTKQKQKNFFIRSQATIHHTNQPIYCTVIIKPDWKIKVSITEIKPIPQIKYGLNDQYLILESRSRQSQSDSFEALQDCTYLTLSVKRESPTVSLQVSSSKSTSQTFFLSPLLIWVTVKTVELQSTCTVHTLRYCMYLKRFWYL